MACPTISISPFHLFPVNGSPRTKAACLTPGQRGNSFQGLLVEFLPVVALHRSHRHRQNVLGVIPGPHSGEILHGGAIMAFADTVGALGTVVNLREGQGTTTVESKTNFFAATPVGTRLVAEATPLHRGRRTQVWETRLTNVEGRLVAKVTQTQMVL